MLSQTYNLTQLYQDVVYVDYPNYSDVEYMIPYISIFYTNIMMTFLTIFLYFRLRHIGSLYDNIRKDFEHMTIQLYDAKFKTIHEIIGLDERSTKKVDLIKKEMSVF